MNLKLSEILAEDNIRHNIDDGSIKELAASILAVHELSGGEKTLLQPVVVCKLEKKTEEGHTHQLRYGFRRLAAFQYLLAVYPEKCFWAKDIPVIVDEAVYNEEVGALANFRLIENIQREDMTLLEEATTLKRIMEETATKQNDLAKTLGKSKGWISQRLALLKMDEAVQLGAQEGKFGQAHVREFARVKKSEQADLAAKLLKEKNLSVDKVRRAVNKVAGPPAEKKSTKKAAGAPTDATPDTPPLKTAGAESGRTATDAPTVASLPKTDPGELDLTRADVLKSMEHAEKLAFLKEEAAKNKADTAAKATSVTAAEITRCATKLEAALARGDAEEAAFFAGAEAGLRFVEGSNKSIRFVRRKAAG